MEPLQRRTRRLFENLEKRQSGLPEIATTGIHLHSVHYDRFDECSHAFALG
jgi:hypothetical protein